MMKNEKTLYLLLLPILILALAAMACGTGYSTSSKLSGSSGEVKVKLGSADGTDTNSVEINEDWSNQRISSTVTATIESGSCSVQLLGDQNTTLSLNPAAGSPAQTFGDLVTDVFGEVDLQTACSGGENLEVVIAFSLK